MISREWKKSEYSTGGNGNCVEVRGDGSDENLKAIEVRDTQNRGLGAIAVTPAAFTGIVSLLKAS